MIEEAFRALVSIALPVAFLSWLLLRRLYNNGKLDRNQSDKEQRASLKELSKQTEEQNGWQERLVVSKWMQFGGGFYGCAALWTFIAVEALDIFILISNPHLLAEYWSDGLISCLVALFINQIQNFVTAIVWFTYWGDGGSMIAIWLLMAYAGYEIGNRLAKHNSLFNPSLPP